MHLDCLQRRLHSNTFCRHFRLHPKSLLEQFLLQEISKLLYDNELFLDWEIDNN